MDFFRPLPGVSGGSGSGPAYDDIELENRAFALESGLRGPHYAMDPAPSVTLMAPNPLPSGSDFPVLEDFGLTARGVLIMRIGGVEYRWAVNPTDGWEDLTPADAASVVEVSVVAPTVPLPWYARIQPTGGQLVEYLDTPAARQMGLVKASSSVTETLWSLPDFWRGGEQLLVPSEYPTIEAALNEAGKRFILPGRRISVVVADRHSEPPFALENVDLSFVDVVPAVDPVERVIGGGGAYTVTGSAGDYRIAVDIGAHDILVGDIVYVWSATQTGNGGNNAVQGCWRVTAVTGTTVTFKNTCRVSGFASSSISGAKLIRVPLQISVLSTWNMRYANTPRFRDAAFVCNQTGSTSAERIGIQLFRSTLNFYEPPYDLATTQERPYGFIVGSENANSLHGISLNYSVLKGAFSACGAQSHGAIFVDDSEFEGRGYVCNGNAATGLIARGGKHITPRYPLNGDVRCMAAANGSGIDLTTMVDAVIAQPAVLANSSGIGVRAQSASRAVVSGTDSVQAYSPSLGTTGNANSIIIKE